MAGPGIDPKHLQIWGTHRRATLPHSSKDLTEYKTDELINPPICSPTNISYVPIGY